MHVCVWEREKGREKWERPSVLEVVRGDSWCPLRSTHAVEGVAWHICLLLEAFSEAGLVPSGLGVFHVWHSGCLTIICPAYSRMGPGFGPHRPCHLTLCSSGSLSFASFSLSENGENNAYVSLNGITLLERQFHRFSEHSRLVSRGTDQKRELSLGPVQL